MGSGGAEKSFGEARRPQHEPKYAPNCLAIIGGINSSAEESDQKIAQLWSNFNNSKARLEEQRKNNDTVDLKGYV